MRAHLITKINLYAPTDIVTIQKCQNNANNRYHFGDIQNNTTNTNTIIGKKIKKKKNGRKLLNKQISKLAGLYCITTSSIENIDPTMVFQSITDYKGWILLSIGRSATKCTKIMHWRIINTFNQPLVNELACDFPRQRHNASKKLIATTWKDPKLVWIWKYWLGNRSRKQKSITVITI